MALYERKDEKASHDLNNRITQQVVNIKERLESISGIKAHQISVDPLASAVHYKELNKMKVVYKDDNKKEHCIFTLMVEGRDLLKLLHDDLKGKNPINTGDCRYSAFLRLIENALWLVENNGRGSKEDANLQESLRTGAKAWIEENQGLLVSLGTMDTSNREPRWFVKVECPTSNTLVPEFINFPAHNHFQSCVKENKELEAER